MRGYIGYTHSETVKYFISWPLGGFLEYSKVLENLRIDRNLVVEANAVFAEEIKNHSIRRFKFDVLKFERTATDSIGFVVSLFIPSTKREFVDEVHGSGSLAISRLFGFHVPFVVFADGVNVFLRCQPEELL